MPLALTAGAGVSCRIHACNAVRELCVGSDANKELFAAEALGTLMDLLTCESQHLQEAALSAVGEILDGCPIAKDIAHNERLIGELLLSSLSQNHRVKLQAAHAIGRLLVDHKDSQRQVSNLELEIAEFDWVPTNGLACLACGLAEEDLEIQLSFAQALLNCVYDDQGNMDILFSDETLQLVWACAQNGRVRPGSSDAF